MPNHQTSPLGFRLIRKKVKQKSTNQLTFKNFAQHFSFNNKATLAKIERSKLPANHILWLCYSITVEQKIYHCPRISMSLACVNRIQPQDNIAALLPLPGTLFSFSSIHCKSDNWSEIEFFITQQKALAQVDTLSPLYLYHLYDLYHLCFLGTEKIQRKTNVQNLYLNKIYPLQHKVLR